MKEWHLLVTGKKAQKSVHVCDLVAGGLQNSIGAFGGHALDDPGPQPFSDEANVRQQLGKLPLETGDLLKPAPPNNKTSVSEHFKTFESSAGPVCVRRLKDL